MKKIFLSFAKYNEESNKTIAGIMGKLSNDDREKNRKSYFGSLSEIFRHNTGTTIYFLSLYQSAVPDNTEARKALVPLANLGAESAGLDGKLSETQWKKAVKFSKIVDKALVDFVSTLKDGDFEAPVKIDWYRGKPPTAPLWFMLQQQVTHNAHHRGQISQIFDSMKIDNNFSGVNIKFI